MKPVDDVVDDKFVFFWFERAGGIDDDTTWFAGDACGTEKLALKSRKVSGKT